MKKKHILLSLLMLIAGLQASAQLLYKIGGAGLEKPSYLFGTHHLAPISVVDSVGAMAPLSQADRVVGEIDMTGNPMALGMAMQKYMIAPADSALNLVLTPEQYARVEQVFAKYAPMPGMQLAMLNGMKPMTVTAMITVGLAAETMDGFDATQQLDTWIQTTGKAAGKEVSGLETPELQASVLYTTTPIAVQAAGLVELVDDPERAARISRDLTAAYLAGDLHAMEQLSAEEDDEEQVFTDALLRTRNADWLTKLPALMQQGSCFIAVGALHLPGKDGLIEGLKAMGYTVTPVNK